MILIPTPAGEFRHRVTPVTRDTTRNELGESTPRSTNLTDTWAKVSPLSAKELQQNAQNNLNVTHEVRLRYRDDLRHVDALLLGDRLLEIASIIDIEEQHVELLILCGEAQA